MHACPNFLQKVFIFFKRFTEMKGINFHSLGLHSFLCMDFSSFLQPQAAWYLLSRAGVQTEVCRGGGAAPEACAHPGPWRVRQCAPHMHMNTSETGRSRTDVNHRACSLSRQVCGNERSPWQPEQQGPLQRSPPHQSQSRGLATGTQRRLKDGRPHGYGQVSRHVWGPGSRNAPAKSIITPNWAGGQLRGFSLYLWSPRSEPAAT